MTSTEMTAFDEMHQLAKKTASLVRAAGSVLDNVIEVKDDDSRERLEDLAHLLGAASEAATATVDAGTRLALESSNLRQGQDA